MNLCPFILETVLALILRACPAQQTETNNNALKYLCPQRECVCQSGWKSSTTQQLSYRALYIKVKEFLCVPPGCFLLCPCQEYPEFSYFQVTK